jgi:hypothetical protein
VRRGEQFIAVKPNQRFVDVAHRMRARTGNATPKHSRAYDRDRGGKRGDRAPNSRVGRVAAVSFSTESKEESWLTA